jgi:hypothetical protein
MEVASSFLTLDGNETSVALFLYIDQRHNKDEGCGGIGKEYY